MKTTEQVLQEKILYIGNDIPESLVNDPRPKFIVLGTPQDFIDETSIPSTPRREDLRLLERNATEIGIRKLALALGQYLVQTQKTELSRIELMRITDAVIKDL